MLFPDLKGHDMVIPAVPLDDKIVFAAREKALDLLRRNFAGPKKYNQCQTEHYMYYWGMFS